jgi:hypothetical protein
VLTITVELTIGFVDDWIGHVHHDDRFQERKCPVQPGKWRLRRQMMPLKGHRAAKEWPDTEAREVRKDMAGQNGDTTLRSSSPSKIRGTSPGVMVSIVVTTRVPNCSLSLKGTRLESFKDLRGTGLMTA